MNTDTKVFLKKKFKEYYWNNKVKEPSEIHKREFGVGTLEDKIKFRHKGFKTQRDLDQYLKTESPYYISYSIAYYEFPENRPIGNKNWLGADLVFDLDRDIGLLNPVELDAVKTEAITLIDFLKNDLGLSDNEIKINFSGSKGYHIHVFNEEYRSLDGDGRREIIDYVTGSGLDIDFFFHPDESPEGLTYKRGKVKMSEGTTIGPIKGDPGWPGRIYDLTEKILGSSKEDLRDLYGISPREASKIVKNREKYMSFLVKGKWDALFSFMPKLKERIIADYSVKYVEDADRMVTPDTSRLIRLPGTLHGGTGLKAGVAKNIDSFNPLVDTVVFNDEQISIRAINDIGQFQMMENKFGPYGNGEVIEIPGYAGIYLMLKEKAEIK